MSHTVTVGGMIAVPRAMHTDASLAQHWSALSAPSPSRASAERMGRPFYHLPERISLLEVDGDRVRYPAACGEMVREWLTGKTFQLVDCRARFAPVQLPYSGTLFPFQLKALNAAIAAERGGMVVAPCGSGKGELIAALVGKLGLPTLIVAPTVDTANDLQSRIKDRLGIACGFVGDARHEVERVTVAIAAALSAEVLRELEQRFEVLIFDEAHHVASPTWQAIANGLHVRKRFGFTATPLRQDGLSAFVEFLVGPTLHRVSRSDLSAAGRATLPEYYQIPTEFSFPYRSRDDWHALQNALAKDAARDALIVDVVLNEAMPEPTAVLVGRVEHAERLAVLLTEQGIRTAALFGKLSGKKRSAILDDMRGGKLDVIVATSLADEGLDLPNLARVVLAWPQRAEGRFVQRVGRILRVQEGKAVPQVFDLVDSSGPLAHQAKCRARTFAQEFGPLRTRAA